MAPSGPLSGERKFAGQRGPSQLAGGRPASGWNHHFLSELRALCAARARTVWPTGRGFACASCAAGQGIDTNSNGPNALVVLILLLCLFHLLALFLSLSLCPTLVCLLLVAPARGLKCAPTCGRASKQARGPARHWFGRGARDGRARSAVVRQASLQRRRQQLNLPPAPRRTLITLRLLSISLAGWLAGWLASGVCRLCWAGGALMSWRSSRRARSGARERESSTMTTGQRADDSGARQSNCRERRARANNRRAAVTFAPSAR